jgi:hypothetical protein
MLLDSDQIKYYTQSTEAYRNFSKSLRYCTVTVPECTVTVAVTVKTLKNNFKYIFFWVRYD